MAVKNSVSAIPLTSVSATTFNGVSYMPINPNGLPNSCFSFTIINHSSVDITISYDGGTTPHDFIPSNSSSFFPLQSNAQPNTTIANMAKGTVVSVLGANGTGSVYLSGFYQQQL
jgi:hypothetical protein